jgi:hypothetical protein
VVSILYSLAKIGIEAKYDFLDLWKEHTVDLLPSPTALRYQFNFLNWIPQPAESPKIWILILATNFNQQMLDIGV